MKMSTLAGGNETCRGLGRLLIVKAKRYQSLFLLLLMMLIILFVLNIGMGSVNIPFMETCRIISQHLTGSVPGGIIWKIRMPRVLSTLFCGGYLAVAGLLLQVFFRNPIVGPYVLGISSGATLMVALVMLAGLSIGILGIHPFFLSVAAFSEPWQ